MTTRTEVPSAPVVYQGGPLPLSQEARKVFTEDTAALLASKIGLAAGVSGVPSPLLYATLELAARYELDPFANEIWVAKMGGRDGGGGQLAIMVGRDGYMKVGKRDPAFLSCAGQAVYTNDELEVEIDETGGVSHFRFKAAHPAKRGEPTGAFAILRRKEPYTPLYFFAPLEQFKKNGGAWKYEDAMIVKCAQSYLLRTTYNVSGAVPHDEITVGFDPERGDVDGSAVDVSAVPALPERLEALLARAEAIDPQSWRRNEVEARVLDAAGAPLLDQARRVERELVEWLTDNDPEYDPRGQFTQPGATGDDQRRGGAPGGSSGASTGDPVPDVPHAETASEEPREQEEEIADADVVEESPGPEPDKLGGVPPSEPDDEPAQSLEDRYRDDESFRDGVDKLVARRLDLEASRDDADARHLAEINAELDVIDDELRRMGVQPGWSPPAAGGEQPGFDF